MHKRPHRVTGSGGRGLCAALALGVTLGLSACAGTGQVARWEADGDDQALRRALDDDSDEVRAAAAQALVRYAGYETARPGVLSTLRSSQHPEAKEALKQLYGVPPKRTPDPHGRGVPPPGDSSSIHRPPQPLARS